MILLRGILLSLVVTGYLAEEIVPVRTGSGPTPKPGGSRRKDPTANLPDLSREEPLAILDLIEKSGDSTPAPDARSAPPRYPTSPSKPLPTQASTEAPFEPAAPTQRPFAGPVYPPTDAPFQRPANPHADMNPITPPNYPAPIAPPLPVSTTPKPKKNFFDKLVGGLLKIVSPQTSAQSGPTRAPAGAFLNSFLAQLQDAHRSNTQQTNVAPTSSANVLNNLLQRLQGQNSEGSQFVTNFVQMLQAKNSPSASDNRSTAAPNRSLNSGEQLLSSLLKSVTQGGQQQGQTAGPSFAEFLQREIFKRNGDASGQSGQMSATDVLLDGFKRVIQQTGRQ